MATAVYDRTKLVDKTLQTVQTNLLEGASGHCGAVFAVRKLPQPLTALVILFTCVNDHYRDGETRVSANLMSLGALDSGLLVDGAIIVLRTVCADSAKIEIDHCLKERMELVFDTTREVIRPALFGVFIITAVYLPIFALEGVEGKMFHPMAITVVIALLSAMLLSVTFVPATIALLFKKPVSTAH